MALGAGVGTELGVAANAHRLALVTDKSPPTQVLPAVEAVGGVCHLGSGGQDDTPGNLAEQEGDKLNFMACCCSHAEYRSSSLLCRGGTDKYVHCCFFC